jgi:hypothetical protein
MKISIATFAGTHNYGAVLQAHALQQILVDFEHTSVFLNFLPPQLEQRNRKILPIRSLKSFLLNVATLPFRSQLFRRYQRFESFRDEFLRKTHRYLSYADVERKPPDVDLYIVGSDQVWNMEQGGNPLFFLRFLGEEGRKVPVIAYAPSFGTATIPEKYERRFQEWATIYDFVSVRESSGKELAERLLGRAVPQVLDPVFLRSADFWRELAGERLRARPYIAFYSLEASGKVSDCLLAIARHFKMPVVVLGKPGTFLLKCRSIVAIDAGPQEFLSWLAHASFVVTNSFHATAFSAIFEVPYATVAHSTRNARMESLLEILDQEDRIIHGVDDLTEARLKALAERPTALDADPESRFVQERKASLAFLENSLRAVEKS